MRVEHIEALRALYSTDPPAENVVDFLGYQRALVPSR